MELDALTHGYRVKPQKVLGNIWSSIKSIIDATNVNLLFGVDILKLGIFSYYEIVPYGNVVRRRIDT